MAVASAATDVNSSIELWELHLSLLQKQSSTRGAALWLLPLLTRTDSNSTRQPSANGKNEGAHPRKMPTKDRIGKKISFLCNLRDGMSQGAEKRFVP